MILIIESIRHYVNLISGVVLLVDFLVMGYACWAFKPHLFYYTACVAIVYGSAWTVTILPYHMGWAMKEHDRLVREGKLKS